MRALSDFHFLPVFLTGMLFCLPSAYGQVSERLIRQRNGDYVIHTVTVSGKAREHRAVFYPAFARMEAILNGRDSPANKATKVQTIERQLPARIEVNGAMIRSYFARPIPELDIEAMPVAASFGARRDQYDSLYDAWPGLKKLPVRASPFFDALYDLKEKRFLASLREKRKGFYPWTMIYDCDTVLEIGDPGAPPGKRILFFQSDLDIDADGSDGERRGNPKEYSKDGAFQPETSYRWSETPRVANPFLEKWKARRENSGARIVQLEAELKKWQSMRPSYGHQIDDDIVEAQRRLNEERTAYSLASARIADVSGMRHLVGELDPFIVAPLSFNALLPSRLRGSAFIPGVGDYALVFYGKKVYPVIVGDQGPQQKCGEASLALARQIRHDNARLRSRKLSAEFSPFYDLEVSYLVFPDTAPPSSKWGEPDLEKWNRDCSHLIEGLGGLAEGFEMHHWKPQNRSAP